MGSLELETKEVTSHGIGRHDCQQSLLRCAQIHHGWMPAQRTGGKDVTVVTGLMINNKKPSREYVNTAE